MRKNGPAKLLGEVEQVILLRLIVQNPGIYLREIQLKLQLAFGVRVGAATICRTLKFMGCTRQRMGSTVKNDRNEEMKWPWHFRSHGDVIVT